MTARNRQPRGSRRRTCRDRWKWHRHQRRRRKATADPAMSVCLELLALVLWVFRAPSVVRCPDGPSTDAVTQESGDGGHLIAPRWDSRRFGRYKTRPSYRRLIRDIQHPAARAEALDMLRWRLDLPYKAQGWLDELEFNGELATLRHFVRTGMTDLASEAALLSAAAEWLEARQVPKQPTTSSRRPSDNGDGRAGNGGNSVPRASDDDDGLPALGGPKLA